MDFARIMLGGNLTVFMIFLMNTNFRGAGDAVLAMRTLWLHLDARLVLGARTRSAVLFKRQRILRSRHSRIHSHHASA
jgi:hypothetical protein